MQKMHRGNAKMLEGLTPPIRPNLCRIHTLSLELEQTDWDILRDALADIQTWPAKTLSKALRERGLQLSDSTITKHRQQLCQCAKGA